MKAFLGLLHLAGLHRSNQLNLWDLQSTDGSGIELLRHRVSLWRFTFIHDCIRFDDKLTSLGCLKVDKSMTFVENCKLYSMGQNVTIEKMVLGLGGK